MKWFLAISLVLLMSDDPPKPDPPKPDTPKPDTVFIVQQEIIQDDLDSMRLSMKILKHKIDSASKK